jgi:hypothetical protein
MIRKIARSLVLGIARIFGTKIVDCSTGRNLGKALFIPWHGKIHVIGLSEAVRPTFFPQKRLSYWKQELGFTVHEKPDFEKLKVSSADRRERR